MHKPECHCSYCALAPVSEKIIVGIVKFFKKIFKF
jgi:hypothetical protein